MKILIVSGSRADAGLLDPVRDALQADPYFKVDFVYIHCTAFGATFAWIDTYLRIYSHGLPDMMLVLGDRFEILAAATAAHLLRVPIAHIGGGDVTEGSYDDAMRDCITRMATIHFTISRESSMRLMRQGYDNVWKVGSIGADVIIYGDWKRERPIAEPYVVVSYQAETISDTVDLDAVNKAIAGRKAVWITPNPDRGNDRIPPGETFSHHDFLNLLYYCDEFIGNSSSMLYEAPFMGVKCKMIGKRQKGRAKPFGDGHACERIVKVLKECKL